MNSWASSLRVSNGTVGVCPPNCHLAAAWPHLCPDFLQISQILIFDNPIRATFAFSTNWNKRWNSVESGIGNIRLLEKSCQLKGKNASFQAISVHMPFQSWPFRIRSYRLESWSPFSELIAASLRHRLNEHWHPCKESFTGRQMRPGMLYTLNPISNQEKRQERNSKWGAGCQSPVAGSFELVSIVLNY